MDTLLATVRAALIAEGASPATAELLAVDLVERSRVRIERDRRDNQAQQQLFKGREVAAEVCGCHPATVYRRAKRAREKFSRFWPAGATSPR